MSYETARVRAYPAALKKSTPQAPGAAPARAPLLPPENRTAVSVPPAKKIPLSKSDEARDNGCLESAHSRETSSGVATWAIFTDVSLHGCYVEVNGFRVESGAEVRVVYPNLGRGICFTTMAGAEQLRSLSRPAVILSPQTVPNAQPIPPPRPESPTISDQGEGAAGSDGIF
jgi:hypothetical protein